MSEWVFKWKTEDGLDDDKLQCGRAASSDSHGLVFWKSLWRGAWHARNDRANRFRSYGLLYADLCGIWRAQGEQIKI